MSAANRQIRVFNKSDNLLLLLLFVAFGTADRQTKNTRTHLA